MKHIVFVVGMYKNGGMERRVTTIANQFAQRGYKCTILVTQEISSETFFPLEKNVEIILLNDYAEACRKTSKDKSEKVIKRKLWLLKRLQHITGRFKKINENISERIKLLRGGQVLSLYVSNNPKSVYIAFGGYCLTCLYAASNKLRVKSIYSETLAPETFLTSENKKTMFFKIVSKANGAIMQTNEELLFYKTYLKNGIVIHNPVKSGLPEQFKEQRRKVVVNYCRIYEQKNIPLLIDAFTLFKKNHPEFTLEIYGNTISAEEDAHLEELKSYVSQRNLCEEIKLLPPRADVHEVIKDCAMFVSSSDYEGLSNSMLEAMAIGLPVVCTDCLGGGARELIRDGENGLLVPMKDVNALANAMCRMVDEDGLSQKCSDNAYKTRDELSVEKIADKWIGFIDSVVG